MNFHEFEKTGKPGRSFQSVAVEGLKRPGRTIGQGFNNWPKDEHGAYIMPDGPQPPQSPRRQSSRSDARKAASAQIAKIPLPLSQHIARVFKP